VLLLQEDLVMISPEDEKTEKPYVAIIKVRSFVVAHTNVLVILRTIPIVYVHRSDRYN
jgi:hypothetical protein